MKKFCLVVLPFLLLAGCLWDNPQKPANPPDGKGAVEKAAREFFDFLHDQEYENAADLYGGSWEVLASMNPDLDPGDGPGLLSRGCLSNGFVCLRMGEVLGMQRSGEAETILVVQFLTESGEIFVLGPCCGESEESMPPVSEFSIRVVRDEGEGFKVLDLPPYVP